MITSLHDKKISNEIMMVPDVTFYGVFFALISLAGSEELARLRQAFPQVVKEAIIRYTAPGGALDLDEWIKAFVTDDATFPEEYLKKQFRKAEKMANIDPDLGW